MAFQQEYFNLFLFSILAFLDRGYLKNGFVLISFSWPYLLEKFEFK